MITAVSANAPAATALRKPRYFPDRSASRGAHMPTYRPCGAVRRRSRARLDEGYSPISGLTNSAEYSFTEPPSRLASANAA